MIHLEFPIGWIFLPGVFINYSTNHKGKIAESNDLAFSGEVLTVYKPPV